MTKFEDMTPAEHMDKVTEIMSDIRVMAADLEDKCRDLRDLQNPYEVKTD